MKSPYTLEFHATTIAGAGGSPFDNLEPLRRAALLAALQEILARQGKDVCDTEYGNNLGKSLYEFRLPLTYDEIVVQYPDAAWISPPSRDREADVLLRVFFYPWEAIIRNQPVTNSAIWTVLRVAPLHRLSPTTTATAAISSHRRPQAAGQHMVDTRRI